jgi:hypothetical protein
MKAAYLPSSHLWVRLYVGLLAGPSSPKIELYQRDSVPYGALWISRITGPWDPAIK